MDLYCQKCGEPWDMDSLWDFEEDDYKGARKDFIKGKGCPSCSWGSKAPQKAPSGARATSVLMGILGDDIDGVACELEDLEYFGRMGDF
jgi:hypothetical protein